MNKTINISLPKSMYEDARDLVKEKRFTSVSELIRHALRDILYPNGLTVNGFTPEFEDAVLEAEKEPVENDIVLETDEDIKNYFLSLKYPSKMKSKNGENQPKRRIRSNVSKINRQRSINPVGDF